MIYPGTGSLYGRKAEVSRRGLLSGAEGDRCAESGLGLSMILSLPFEFGLRAQTSQAPLKYIKGRCDRPLQRHLVYCHFLN